MRASSKALAALAAMSSLLPIASVRAADAVVAAEPEPMDYVKICDAYGDGYFYIPGTATCLRVRGLVRLQANFESFSPNRDGIDRAKTIRTQAQLEAFARNDSEYGMVYSWVQMQRVDRTLDRRFDDASDNGHYWEESASQTSNMKALFGIGPAEFGYNDSQFAVFFGNGGTTDWAGRYMNSTYKIRHQASYTLYADYLTAIVSLESGQRPDNRNLPDVVAGARYDFGQFNVSGGLAYDQYDGSFAFVGRFDAAIDRLTFVLEGLGANSKTNGYFDYDGVSVLAGASIKVTEKLTLATDLQVWDNEDWLSIADAAYVVTPGFQVLGEVAMGDMEGAKRKAGVLKFERLF